MKKTVIKRRKRVPAVGNPIKSSLQVDDLAGSDDRNPEQLPGAGPDAQAVAGSRESSYLHSTRKANTGPEASTAQNSSTRRHTQTLTDSPSPRSMEAQTTRQPSKGAVEEEAERDAKEGVSVGIRAEVSIHRLTLPPARSSAGSRNAAFDWPQYCLASVVSRSAFSASRRWRALVGEPRNETENARWRRAV